MTQTAFSNSKAFTIIESLIVLGTLFVLTMLLVALYRHSEDGTSASQNADPLPAIDPGYRFKSSNKDFSD